MTEEYYEKKDMERDLGTEVEPYTPEEIDEMYAEMKEREKEDLAVRAYIRKIRLDWKLEWEGL